MLDLRFDPFPTLATERLRLREMEARDVPALFALRSDPRVMRHIGRPLARVEDDAARLLADMRTATAERAGIAWALTLADDDELVGTFGFWRIAAEHHRGELGYLLRPDLWGRGFAREAGAAVVRHGFEVFGFHRIEACVDPTNAASIRVLEKLGFEREGLHRGNFHFEGRFLDTLMFARLARPSP